MLSPLRMNQSALERVPTIHLVYEPKLKCFPPPAPRTAHHTTRCLLCEQSASSGRALFYPLPLGVREVCRAWRSTLRWAWSCIYCFLVVIQRHRLRFPSHRVVACGWHIALKESGRPGVKPSPEDSGTQFPLSAPPTKRTGAPSPAASTPPLCPHHHPSLHTCPAFSSSLHGSKPPTGSVGRRPPQGQGSVWGAADPATPADFGPCRGVGEPGAGSTPNSTVICRVPREGSGRWPPHPQVRTCLGRQSGGSRILHR